MQAADASPSPRPWRKVLQRAVEDTPWEKYGDGWALFLSWVPHWSEAGLSALQAFQGSILVVLGDGGGWTGTKAFHEELASREWVLLESWATTTPWPRVEETLRIYTRKGAGNGS
eukprot:TRINITY_DN40294_c0_g1_i1.p3 TRINITY_DN40294_c0_g1~~TRINITY_DN40294_c0_g1_i1.p3  ORF type:complete len:115 (+),score=23.30 TRINITY_DN40294_c0_g1_i1:85-429(+)